MTMNPDDDISRLENEVSEVVNVLTESFILI